MKAEGKLERAQNFKCTGAMGNHKWCATARSSLRVSQIKQEKHKKTQTVVCCASSSFKGVFCESVCSPNGYRCEMQMLF